MDWLYDHKAEFEKAVESKLGKQDISWENPKLIIIAQKYNKFDKYAVNRVSENVYLYKYYLYEYDSLYLENVNAKAETYTKGIVLQIKESVAKEKYDIESLYNRSSEDIIELYKELKEQIVAIDENIEEIITKKLYFF